MLSVDCRSLVVVAEVSVSVGIHTDCEGAIAILLGRTIDDGMDAPGLCGAMVVCSGNERD